MCAVCCYCCSFPSCSLKSHKRLNVLLGQWCFISHLNLKLTDLINEGSKAVVQGLDLLLLLGADHLDGGVDLQVHGGQEALVHGHCCDGGHDFIGHATSHTSTKAHIAKLYSTSPLSRPPSNIPTNHFKSPSAHSSTAAAHSPIGAADSIALPATAHTMATVAREGAAAEALGWAPGGGHSGEGGGLHGSDRHGH